jgi:hypothetical protein
MVMVNEGNLKCPRCREYVIEADPEEYPDGVDHETPGADESDKPCGECAPHVENGRPQQTPQDEFKCKLLRNSSLRNISRVRMVATYHGNWWAGAPRIVGLLVPRRTQQDHYGSAFIHFTDAGKIIERRLGCMPGGPHGEWYTARASELPREKWQALRNFYNNLPH